MSSKPWSTNAHARIADFVQRQSLGGADVETLLQFAQRLTIDPFDMRAERDGIGEFYCRIGPSQAHPDRDLAAGYRIDEAYRTVDVISFSLVPAR